MPSITIWLPKDLYRRLEDLRTSLQDREPFPTVSKVIQKALEEWLASRETREEVRA